jgi:16S rRNA pseudouridine516 synthase
LDRFISAKVGINRSHVRLLLAKKQVTVDGVVATDISQSINQFSRIKLDGQLLQDNQPMYVMLHKPAGVVSATRDDNHKTVIDLLDVADKENLHIVGRLDFNSSGLVLLTNDGKWSRQLTSPENKIAKVYQVTLEDAVSEECITAFAEGIYFAFEGLTTRPASIELLSDRVAMVTLIEGRYHQIKRMFGRFQNKVLSLHRIAIGNIQLEAELKIGQSRSLTVAEVSNFTG